MAEQPSSGTPLWPGPGDLASRLDRLEGHLAELDGLRAGVESALVAQASRIESVLTTARRDLVDSVAAEAAGARHAADEVREALARARDLTADRLDAAAGASGEVVEVVRAALARLEATTDDRLDEAAAGARAATAPVEALAGAVESLHELVADARAEAAQDRARVDALTEQVHALADTIASGLEDVTDALDRQADAAAVAVRSAAGEAGRDMRSRLDDAADPLRDAVRTVQALDTSLRQHVDEMEWRATAERARLTQSFVEQLADGLGRRDRRRLARRIEVPPHAAPPGGEPEESPPPPAPDPGPDPVAAESDGEPAPVVDEVPSSGRTGGPTEVRRALAAVRGLGPARQSALIDRFGTLEAIRDAADDELLDVPGIGEALLPGIRDAVG